MYSGEQLRFFFYTPLYKLQIGSVAVLSNSYFCYDFLIHKIDQICYICNRHIAELKRMNPTVVEWQVTSKCNRVCDFCFGPKDLPELSLEEVTKMIDILKSMGTKVIGLTGGEPLMRPDIVTIFQVINQAKMGICLFTNCDFFKRYRKAISAYVDVLCIPIDGSQVTHDRMRGKGSFKRVTDALRDVFLEKKLCFQVGTVVTTQNYFDIASVEGILSPYKERIILWKLYELICYPARSQYASLHVDNHFFEKEILPKLGGTFDKDKIIFDTIKTRNKGYFLMKPNGDVFVPILDSRPAEGKIGNILTEPEAIRARWNEIVDVANYVKPERCPIRKDTRLKERFLGDV